ncbi:MAG: hypothetical protein KC583_22885 [Myxococcales bacterium]|nr:hypothetical protein [Myxococcales bacterium]
MRPGVGASPDRWRRCLVGERGDVAAGEGQLRVACAAVPGGTVTTRTQTQPVGRDQQATIHAGCAADEVLIGGGGEWPVDWIPFANRPVVDAGTGKLVWEIAGVGAPSDVAVQAICAAGVPEPTLASKETLVMPGGQCADVECPAGLLRLTGGALWAIGMDPDQNRPGAAGSWTFCAFNPVREERPFLVSALCVPIQRGRALRSAPNAQRAPSRIECTPRPHDPEAERWRPDPLPASGSWPGWRSSCTAASRPG